MAGCLYNNRPGDSCNHENLAKVMDSSRANQRLYAGTYVDLRWFSRNGGAVFKIFTASF